MQDFVESWGMMGSLWGINNSTARIHAQLIASEDPLSLDGIAEALQISRGNASMCLRELRNWGVVHLVKVPGDRRDYYTTEPDIWKMFFVIIRERKRREFDPIMNVVRETLAEARKTKGGIVETRLQQMEELLSTLELIAEQFLADEDKARSVLSFVAGMSRSEGEHKP